MLAKKGLRTGRQSISAGQEDGDKVTGLRTRHHDVIGESIERRAEAADNIGFFARGLVHPPGQSHRIIAAHDLAEIARCGELMMHAAIGDQKDLAVAFLSIEDPGEIDARLAHQPAPQFDRKLRFGENRTPSCDRLE